MANTKKTKKSTGKTKATVAKKTQPAQKPKSDLLCSIATCFNIGEIRGCHGTWGSLAIIPIII